MHNYFIRPRKIMLTQLLALCYHDTFVINCVFVCFALPRRRAENMRIAPPLINKKCATLTCGYPTEFAFEFPIIAKFIEIK